MVVRCAGLLLSNAMENSNGIKLLDRKTKEDNRYDLFRSQIKQYKLLSLVKAKGKCRCKSCGCKFQWRATVLLPNGLNYKYDKFYSFSYGRFSERTIDHKWPKSRGGLDKESNYQYLCEFCNIRKDNNLNADIIRQALDSPDSYIDKRFKNKKRKIVKEIAKEIIPSIPPFLIFWEISLDFLNPSS